MRFPQVVLALPEWIEASLPDANHLFTTVQERMCIVIDLAQSNIEHQTGGPFAAAVFEQQSGRLIAPGVNMVTGSNYSSAHAEIVAFAIAQKMLGTYDLGAEGMPAYELVSSTEPCAMCLGAVVWSGVRSLVCGARDEDAREIGFDEGPKPADWAGCLRDRGVNVVRDILRDQAKAVLLRYSQSGGVIYNPRRQSGQLD
ncbi:MAG: nucleoside deaminase [Planctomycetota bacterium]|jgi:tRNA(Arg) A34 adenosine deaminase TadA